MTMNEIGEKLKRGREARNLTIERASEVSRVKAAYLEALESENWDALPGATYTRGFIRLYSRAVGLDPAPLVEAFNRLHAPEEDRSAVVRRNYRGTPRLVLGPQLLAMGATALLAIVFATYLFRQVEAFRSSEVVAAPSPGSSLLARIPSPYPSARPLVSPSPSPATGLAATISLDGVSWVQVSTDGRVVFERTYPAGTVLQAHADHDLRIWAGVASRVKVSIDGADLGAVGPGATATARDYILKDGRPVAGPAFNPTTASPGA